MTKSLFCQWEESGEKWACIQCGAEVPKSVAPKKPLSACPKGAEDNGVPFREIATAKLLRQRQPPVYGPGTELKKLLTKLGIRATDSCPCNSRAIQMNLWGPEICEQKIDEIVGWLREESKRRGLPFVDAAGRVLVRRAISNYKKQKQTP